MSELARCIDFIRELEHRAAGEQIPFPFGIAYLHSDFPGVWSRNYLVAERNLEAATPELLAAEAERILGGARLRHRKIELNDDGVGARLEPGFRTLGWAAECDLLMVAAGEPDRAANTARVVEVGYEALAPVWERGIRSEGFPWATEDVIRQLVENKLVVMASVPTRFFAALVDGEIASYCDLYSYRETGQIEAVMTHEPYRNRGLARAVVLRALEESRAAGNDLTFLMAHRDDWPHVLYGKLGFEEVGRVWEFVRPASAAP